MAPLLFELCPCVDIPSRSRSNASSLAVLRHEDELVTWIFGVAPSLLSYRTSANIFFRERDPDPWLVYRCRRNLCISIMMRSGQTDRCSSVARGMSEIEFVRAYVVGGSIYKVDAVPSIFGVPSRVCSSSTSAIDFGVDSDIAGAPSP